MSIEINCRWVSCRSLIKIYYLTDLQKTLLSINSIYFYISTYHTRFSEITRKLDSVYTAAKHKH